MKKSRIFKSNYFLFKISWIVFICFISVLISKFAMSGINDMLALGKTSDIVQIELEDNTSIDEISNILEEKHIISEKWFFKIYSLATKAPKNYLPGIYEVEVGMDYQSVINRLKDNSNKKDVVNVTITEGMNILECAATLEANGVCGKDDFLNCCNSGKFEEKYSFLKDSKALSSKIYKVEGYIFPDTYKFYRNEKPINVIIKCLNNYQKKLSERNNVKGYSSPISIEEIANQKNISLDKATTIASLIQAEAANKEDMYQVSSVIKNRLDTEQNGGKNKFGEFSMNFLRIDATTYYPYKNQTAMPKEIKKSFSSNYNTYKNSGLPPGPICNVGLDALYAALDPAQTEYYYYCHNNVGETFFAKTNSTHLINMKKAGLTN